MKTFRFSVFAVFLSLALAGTLAAKDKEKDADDDSDSEVTVEKLTLVKDTGKDFQPVKKFKPTDIFGVLVQLSAAKEGTKVKGVWTAVDAGGMHDKELLQKKVDYTADAIKSAKDPTRVDFTLDHDKPYPPGDYKFEIYLNGELADTIEFTIEE